MSYVYKGLSQKFILQRPVRAPDTRYNHAYVYGFYNKD